MEGTTDPSVLENRLYYKIGCFVYDNAKVVLVATLILGVSLAGLITLEPKYIEGFGEGDLESVHGWSALASGFSDENDSGPPLCFLGGKLKILKTFASGRQMY